LKDHRLAVNISFEGDLDFKLMILLLVVICATRDCPYVARSK